MTAQLVIWHALRLFVIIFGGAVVGTGFAVLAERSRYYRRHCMPCAIWAMRLLACMNALVLAYVAAVMIDRWDHPVGWRWAGGIAIFATKGLFFYLLRETGIEQERRQLYGTFNHRPGDRPERRSLGLEAVHRRSGAPSPRTRKATDPMPCPPYDK